MSPDAPPSPRARTGRWTPARLIVLGAVLGFGSAALDASVALSADLSLLAGILSTVPGWLFVLDAALADLLVPVGFFLVLGGLLLAVRSARPPGRSRAFRAGLGGAALNLAAGLLLGVVNFSPYVLPPELLTVDLLRNVVMVLFLGAVVAGAGLLVALCAMAAIVREEPAPGPAGMGVRVRTPRGKSIYRGAPSAR